MEFLLEVDMVLMGDFMELGNTKLVTPQQAARLKKIKAAAAKVKADKQRRVRDRIEELTREKCDEVI